ncbi:MAG: phosphoenolpyruvate--protein phosphotransferase, partial [Parachlamydiaceae bacterium]
IEHSNISSKALLRAETYDGYTVKLSANVEMASEVKALHQHGGNGVGLFRSEYAFLSHASFPTQEEQYRIYKEAVESMHGLPIVIRAFDLGGDKYLLGQKIPFESNPFLGCRAIRFLLKEKELFKEQLKAILRASNYGDVSLMLPMISSLAELQESKELLLLVQKEIEYEHRISVKGIRVGCMIEVPSAALITDLLAKECDFLSIGTNDLVQYALAVDRGNHALSHLYAATDPSIIRLIKLIVCEAHACGIPVSICGEVAANPKFTALLLGLGVHELSVSIRKIPLIKEAIRNTSIIEAIQLAEKALTLSTSGEVEALLETHISEE